MYIVLGALLALYGLWMVLGPAEGNSDGRVTLDKADKNRYGAYILFHQLKDLFPRARITPNRVPLQPGFSASGPAAYLLLAPGLRLTPQGAGELLAFVRTGHTVFVAAASLQGALADSLGLQLSTRSPLEAQGGAARINLTSPALATDRGYGFRPATLDHYFSQVDTLRTEVLGRMDGVAPNFIRIRWGQGQLYVHADPLCFSNDFLLFEDNHSYTAKALSYLPAQTGTLYWDDYYRYGPTPSGGVMQFVLDHLFLRWAWWIALAAALLYVVFESRRRQRPIPPWPAPVNTSVDFVRVVGDLYFNQGNHKHLAEKKIRHFLEFARSTLQLSDRRWEETLAGELTVKCQVPRPQAEQLIDMMIRVKTAEKVSNTLLSQLNSAINAFYQKIR